MELDSKQKVLLAIYTEYQKDIPEMNSITPERLGIDNKIFHIALQKLENENLLRDVQFVGGNPSLRLTNMTSNGLEYVEEKLGIKATMSGSQKVKEVMKKCAKFEYIQLKEFAIQVLSEIK